MGISEVILICICASLVVYCRIQRRRTIVLGEEIDRFINDGVLTPLSTGDDALARLQCRIRELELRLCQCEQSMRRETKSSADFLADVSHQLKTPLAALRLYSELEESAPGAYGRQRMELIERMEELVRNLLELERFQSEVYAMEFRVWDLAQIAREVCMELAPLYPEKKLCVHGEAVLRCDRFWISQAMHNVLKNACEHTASDGLVELRMEQGEQSVTLHISDDGGGVPEEQLTKLFRRFYRAANAQKDSTGIGLAMTRVITEKHHGTIQAENTGKGLRVTMCFPEINANAKL